MTAAHWCEVIPDGIDFDIECVCGHRQRNVAATEDEARRVADNHEQQCNGEAI